MGACCYGKLLADNSHDSIGEVSGAYTRAVRLSKRPDINELIFPNPSDHALFRGISSTDVLRRCCKVMESSTCTEQYFQRSKQVDHVRTFISHNWGTPRRDKCLVLLLYFNALPAVISGLVASTASFALVVVGRLPTLEYDVPGVHVSCWCGTAYVLVFFISLASFSDLARLLGFHGSSCFLDKCCVNQGDAEGKARAIENLASFLYFSWDVLIVYTDTYLQRLWTVYEIASFLMLHQGVPARVWPVKLAWIIVGGICIVYLSWMLSVLAHLRVVREIVPQSWVYAVLLLLCAAVSGLLAIPLSRAWSCERANIRDRINSFSLASAECFAEEDRRAVTRDILRFMRFFEFVGDEASDEAALAEFEKLARTEVPRMLTSSFGRAGLQYRYVLVLAAPTLGILLDYIAASVLDGLASWQVLFSLTLRFMGHTCCTIPLTVFVALRLGEYTYALERRRWNRCMLTFGGAFLFLLFYFSLEVLEYVLVGMDVQDPISWGCRLCTVSAQSCIVFFCYRAPPRKRYTRRLPRDGIPP